MHCFDKTGTITKGKLEAVNYYLEKDITFDQLISTANSVAHKSLHPISHSISQLCSDIAFDKDLEITEFVGRGVFGKKDNIEVRIGSFRWFEELNFDITDKYESEGAATWVAKNDIIIGCILFNDTVRDESLAMMTKLHTLGIEQTVLLTGDNATSAEKIKNLVGFDQMFCSMMPKDKLSTVKELKSKHTVVVVGDGINDSLALSEADVGIAMGAMGSDTAIQSADIALMNNNLKNIPFVIELARKTKSIIMQNIILAFCTSFLMIILASTGIVTAIFGAILHNIGAFFVLLNSGRLLKTRKPKKQLTDKS